MQRLIGVLFCLAAFGLALATVDAASSTSLEATPGHSTLKLRHVKPPAAAAAAVATVAPPADKNSSRPAAEKKSKRSKKSKDKTPTPDPAPKFTLAGDKRSTSKKAGALTPNNTYIIQNWKRTVFDFSTAKYTAELPRDEATWKLLWYSWRHDNKRVYTSKATQDRAYAAFKARVTASHYRNIRVAKAKKIVMDLHPVFNPMKSPFADIDPVAFKKRYSGGRPKLGSLAKKIPVRVAVRKSSKKSNAVRFAQRMKLQDLPDPLSVPAPAAGDQLPKKRIGGDQIPKKRLGGDQLPKKRIGGTGTFDGISYADLNAQNVKDDLEGKGWRPNTMFGFNTLVPNARMSIDLSSTMFPSQIRSQGDCQSCWAVVAAEHFQAVYSTTALPSADTTNFRLSAQQIIDCQRSENDKGCSGGTVVGAFDFIQKTGITYSNGYPYGLDGTQHECAANLESPSKTKRVNLKAKRSIFLVEPCLGDVCQPNPSAEQALLDFWQAPPYKRVTSGKQTPIPVVAYVDSSNWGDYAGGVFPASECSNAGKDLIHIVQIVGYGVDAVSKEQFWLVRNSWGKEWGEKGYIRLPVGSNACGLFNYVIYLEAATEGLSSPGTSQWVKDNVRGGYFVGNGGGQQGSGGISMKPPPLTFGK